MARRNLMRRRAASGQAMVELVLGIIVFVTVLIFGIHFAEVGALSVKVTEAQHSAAFDATGHKLHDWPKDESPANDAVSKASKDAQARYRDFDSRSGGGGASLTQVFTKAENFNVTCRIGEGPAYAQGITTGAYGDNKGMNCQSTAQVSSTGIPTSFMDQGTGFFAVKHHVPITIGVCGFGRGDCTQRKLIMLLDDWGLSQQKESKNCVMQMDSPGCDNTPFWDMAESVYNANGGGYGSAGSSLVRGVLEIPSPIDEQQFWMSASLTETKFKQSVNSEGLTNFTTTPHEAHYSEAYGEREKCWLGLECP
jgi:hypothetical protein